MKRTKIDLATGEKVSNKAAKAARMKKVTCGYCGQRGHTRRTCEKIKSDKQVFVEQHAACVSLLLRRRERSASVLTLSCRLDCGATVDGKYGNHITLRYIKSIDWILGHATRPNLTVKHVDARKARDHPSNPMDRAGSD